MIYGSWKRRVDNRINRKRYKDMVENSNNEIWVSLSHSNKDYEKVRQVRKILTSVSGRFFVDENGFVQRFEPAGDNPFVEEEAEFNDNYAYTYTTHKSIRTMIIPNGVKGFVSDFMRGVKVKERFELPEGLESIGNNSFNINKEEHCVFANCILPSVVIPRSVKDIGNFAFGHTHIESLQLPATLRSPYSRQFKNSYIGLLRLPNEWMDKVSLEDDGHLSVNSTMETEIFGYLRWPSTYVEKMEFY